MMKNFNVSQITVTNIDAIYTRNYNRYLFDNSDEVEIDGVIFFDKFERLMLLFNDKNGQNSIKSKTVTTNDVKDGFPITELHFINFELENIINVTGKNFKEKEQLNIYLNKLNEKKLSITENMNNKKVDSIISDKPIESNPHPNIFVDKFSFDLFEILFDLYKNNENKNANFSFVYHQMLKDKKIQEYCKAEMFRDWLNKQPYMMNIEELFKSSSKALTEKKIDNYNSLRDVLKNSTL